jgi:uncharacterized protein
VGGVRGTLAGLVAWLALLGACAAPAAREAVPPHPYTEAEVSVPHGEVVLAGTLTVPDGPGPHPALVMITGRGPHDREETLGPHRPFLVLADALARAGVAVLRTDDRGVGGSTGSLAAATYDDLAGDALAGVALLAGRPEIDPRRIGLLGHSEGGYLAPLAAGRADGRAPVAFVITLAGPAVPGDDVLVAQSRLIRGLPGAGGDPDGYAAFVESFTARLRAGDRDGARALAERAVARADPGASAEEQRAGVVALMDREKFLLYDPAPALRALRVPVLALFGGVDRQVPPEQNEPPMRALLAAGPDPTVRTFPGLNHSLQPSATGDPAEYATIPAAIAPEVLDAITTWTSERFG